jgi:plastocyanin
MASLCGSSQAGKNVEVDWVIPQDGALPNMNAKVGDTAIFNWSGFHNVLIHPSGNCDEEGAIDVGATSGASYTFEEKDVGEVVFACDVGSHCEFGQIVTFEVKGPDNNDTVSIQPTVTSGGCYDMEVHACGCDLDACDEAKCTAKGRLWTDQCPTPCDAEACAAGIEEKEEDPMNILDTLEASGNFGTLLGAIESTGLTDILNGDGPFSE